MKNLKFFRKETYEQRKKRMLNRDWRTPIPAPLDKDIDHMYMELEAGNSVALEIGDKIVSIKVNPAGYPIIQVLPIIHWPRRK